MEDSFEEMGASFRRLGGSGEDRTASFPEMEDWFRRLKGSLPYRGAPYQ
jgi:hypothetical protein